MEEFIQPLLKEALAKKTRSPEAKDEKAIDGSETLLEHLVNLTDG